MTFTDVIFYFLVGTFSCVGFCFIINVPKNCIAVASITGGIAWLTYQVMVNSDFSKAMAAFCAAMLVAVLSDIFSRTFKEAATVYIIPGILPLVPGAGMYYAMTYLIDGNYELAATTARETFFIAGAIALALLVIGSIVRTIISIIKKPYSH